MTFLGRISSFLWPSQAHASCLTKALTGEFWQEGRHRFVNPLGMKQLLLGKTSANRLVEGYSCWIYRLEGIIINDDTKCFY
jgi:hypothetical protein